MFKSLILIIFTSFWFFFWFRSELLVKGLDPPGRRAGSGAGFLGSNVQIYQPLSPPGPQTTVFSFPLRFRMTKSLLITISWHEDKCFWYICWCELSSHLDQICLLAEIFFVRFRMTKSLLTLGQEVPARWDPHPGQERQTAPIQQVLPPFSTLLHCVVLLF